MFVTHLLLGFALATDCNGAMYQVSIMNEWIARGLGEGSETGAVRKRDETCSQLTWGPVVLDDDEFAEFEQCIQERQRPTPSIVEGAEQLRKLYSKSR